MLTDEVLRVAAAEVQQFLVESVPEEEAAHKFSEDFEKKMKKMIRRERMRRWLPTLIFLMVALVVFICSQFADPNTLWIEPLSDADKEHLTKAVADQTDIGGYVQWREPGYSNPYYGTINNCAIVRTTSYYDVDVFRPGRFETAGYIFYWDEVFELYAYHNGEVCRLDEAYERGWLTREQIGVIYDKHQEYISLLPEGMQEYLAEWAAKVEEKLRDSE